VAAALSQTDPGLFTVSHSRFLPRIVADASLYIDLLVVGMIRSTFFGFL
jgi:hypothetical protein